MTARIRLLVALSRPPVLILLALFAHLGLAQANAANDGALLARALLVVAGFLLFSVVVNDLADEAVDRVNLPADHSRPLVTGTATRRDLPVTAATAAAVALAAAATLGWRPLAVVVGGLLLSAAYSLPPTRLSARGAVASLVLPAGYVAVPFLVGLFAVRPGFTADDAVLLAGLYVGFIGRILLKDFRDVVGDAQFGKRTFLVRHGRAVTCKAAAAAWVLGLFALAGVRDLSPALVAVHLACVGAALTLLRLLAQDRGARRDEWLISAIAVLGRGMVVTVIAHLAMTDKGLPVLAVAAITLAIGFITIGQAVTMARRGPVARSRVPAAWTPRRAEIGS